MKTLAGERWTAEILRRLRTLPPDATPRWGRMSVHQMVCHLADANRMALGDRPVSDAQTRMPRALVRSLALYTPFPWRPGIPTMPEIDQLCSGTPPRDFEGDLAEAERLLRIVVTRPPEYRWPRHPCFGRLSRRAWLRWAYLHTDHHLRQFGA